MNLHCTKRRARVYVAGPYTQGDVARNVAEAIDTADWLLDLGVAPHCPQLNHFWHMAHPHSRESWLELDNEWLPCCDAVFRMPGKSEGADAEVQLAVELSIPVFTAGPPLIEWLEQWRARTESPGERAPTCSVDASGPGVCLDAPIA